MSRPVGPTRERIKQAHKHDGGYLPPEVSHGARRQHGRVIPKLESYVLNGTFTSHQYLAALEIERCCQILNASPRIASYGGTGGNGTPYHQRSNAADLERQDAIIVAGEFVREAHKIVANQRAWDAMMVVVALGLPFERAGIQLGYKPGSSAKITGKKMTLYALDKIAPLLAAWRAATS